MTQIGNRAGIRVGVLCSLASSLVILFCVTACGAVSTASGRSSRPALSVGTAVSRRSPAAALTQWLQQVVRGNYRAACQDMVPPLGSIPTPVRIPGDICSSSSSRVLSELAHLHGNFTIDGITPRSSIRIVTTHIKATTATVRGTDISISGTTLTSRMVAHSTGVKPGEFNISFMLSRVRGSWYVTGMNLAL